VTDDAENGASNGYLAGGSVGQKGLVDTAESYNLLGDVNEDGEVDYTDAELVRKNILGDTAPINTSAADANKDGKINVCDLVAICNKADTE
jgi:hypothetical protein